MKFYKFATTVSRFVLSLFYRIKYVGRENIPENGGYIICCNHQCMFDPLLLTIHEKRQVIYMAKAELFKMPFVRLLVKGFEAFPVERGKGDTGALDKACDVIKSGKIFGIFPEGTRSKDGNLLRFKSGASVIAAKTGADILPVAIAYQNNSQALFHKVVVSYGKVIKNSELGITGTSPSEIKGATRLLTERISELLEQGKAQV